LLICWSTVFCVFAAVGLFSCRLLEIAPLPNAPIDAVSGAPLPLAMFGLVFYKDVFQDLGIEIEGQDVSPWFGQSCVPYPASGGPMDKDSPNVLDMICGYANLSSLLLGVVSILVLCLASLIDRCRLVAYRFAGFGFMMSAIGQSFTFLIWSGEVCDNNVVLEQAGLLEFYSGECKFGVSAIYIIIASCGWFFSFIFCQIIGRGTNSVKGMLAGGSSQKDGETDPDEDEHYQSAAYTVGYDDDGNVVTHDGEGPDGTNRISAATATADALSKLLDDDPTAMDEDASSILLQDSKSSVDKDDRLVRKGSQNCLQTLTPCGGSSFDWTFGVPNSCDPSGFYNS
jgi:hypothetical protein